MTIEKCWEIANEEMHLQNSILCKALHDATWRIASENQKLIDIEKLKNVMNRLMLDTKDKAEIIKAMEE